MIKIIVGDTGRYLSSFAVSEDKKSMPVFSTPTNHGTYFVSLGDFNNVQTFCDILLSADELIYFEPNQWSNLETKLETEKHLAHWSAVKNLPVKNITFNTLYKTSSISRQHGHQIWFTGCSITAGNGVEPHDCYTNAIGQYFNLPCQNLSYPGASNAWAARQIMLSDLRKNDIVIFGITSWARISMHVAGIGEIHINPNYLEHYPICKKLVSVSNLESNDNFYQGLNQIACVENFCKVVGAKLILLGLLTDSKFESHLTNKTTFVGCPRPWKDLGSDNLHPGPQQHAEFAKLAIEKYLTVYGT